MTLNKDNSYKGKVIRFSQSNNLVVREYSSNEEVVVLVNETHNVEQGDTVEFKITQTGDDHHIAKPNKDRRIEKAEYDSSPNIPLHHDGKHGQSVGDTRPESFSISSPHEKEYDPEIKGAPDISKNLDSYEVDMQTNQKDTSCSLSNIAKNVGTVNEFV